MRSFRTHLLVFAIALFLPSCASSVNKVMDSWIGSHQSDLIASWGPPARTASDGKGGTILIYEQYVDLGQKAGRATVDSGGNVRYTAPESRGYTQTRMFYVNDRGIIYHWMWQGL
jgi:hypothetical protein